MSCEGCYSCNSCYSCQTCYGCYATCNSCNADCETEQSLCSTNCQLNSQYAKTFSWDKCATQNEIMGPGYFDKDSWNKLISWINVAANQGSLVSGGSTYPLLSPSSTPYFFTAAEYNRVASIIGSSRRVNSNDIIYGKYFDPELVTAAANFKINSDACDSCNASCDGCNSCEGYCNSGYCGYSWGSYTTCEDPPAEE